MDPRERVETGDRLTTAGVANGVRDLQLLPRDEPWSSVEGTHRQRHFDPLALGALDEGGPVRIRSRKRVTDSWCGGLIVADDGAVTFDEFQRRETQENTLDPAAQRLSATFDLADRVIENEGDLQQLHRAVERLLADLERET